MFRDQHIPAFFLLKFFELILFSTCFRWILETMRKYKWKKRSNTLWPSLVCNWRCNYNHNYNQNIIILDYNIFKIMIMWPMETADSLHWKANIEPQLCYYCILNILDAYFKVSSWFSIPLLIPLFSFKIIYHQHEANYTQLLIEVLKQKSKTMFFPDFHNNNK